MAAPLIVEPTLRSRKKRKPIGYLRTEHICLACVGQIDDLAMPYFSMQSELLQEGDDAGVPFECDRCGERLEPDG